MKSLRLSHGTRHAAALIAAIVALAVAGVVFVNLLRVVVMQSGRVELLERQLQADALVDAGIRRGLSRMRGDSGFEKETWRPPLEAPAEVAVVEIQILPASDGVPARLQVTVTYGDAAGQPLRREKRLMLARAPQEADS